MNSQYSQSAPLASDLLARLQLLEERSRSIGGARAVIWTRVLPLISLLVAAISVAVTAPLAATAAAPATSGNVNPMQVAADLARQALERLECLDDRPGRTEALQQVSLAALARDDLGAAEAAAQRALHLARELDDKWGVAGTQEALARVAMKRGDLEAATRLARESVRVAVSVDHQARLISTLETLGQIAARGGQPRRAVRLLTASAAARERLGIAGAAAERDASEQTMRVAREHESRRAGALHGRRPGSGPERVSGSGTHGRPRRAAASAGARPPQ
jgi:tetratricopeptide (TPR) repeat protein